MDEAVLFFGLYNYFWNDWTSSWWVEINVLKKSVIFFSSLKHNFELFDNKSVSKLKLKLSIINLNK